MMLLFVILLGLILLGAGELVILLMLTSDVGEALVVGLARLVGLRRDRVSVSARPQSEPWSGMSRALLLCVLVLSIAVVLLNVSR